MPLNARHVSLDMLSIQPQDFANNVCLIVNIVQQLMLVRFVQVDILLILPPMDFVLHVYRLVTNVMELMLIVLHVHRVHSSMLDNVYNVIIRQLIVWHVRQLQLDLPVLDAELDIIYQRTIIHVYHVLQTVRYVLITHNVQLAR